MAVTRTIRTPETNCPYCGKKLDACTDPDDINSPSKGDVSVCLGCGGLLEFGENMTPQRASISTIEAFRVQQPADYQKVLKAKQFIELRNRS